MAVMSPTGTTFMSNMAKIRIGILQIIAKYCVPLMGRYAVLGTGLQNSQMNGFIKERCNNKSNIIKKFTAGSLHL